MIAVVLVGCLAGTLTLMLAVRELLLVASDRRRVVSAVIGDDGFGGRPLVDRWDRVFRNTRLGRRLQRELVLAGVERRPVVVFGAAVAVAVMSCGLLWQLFAPAFGVLGLTIGFFAVRGFLSRERSRRLEAFVTQMPELARVLANATHAGLSIHTSVGIAAEELEEPARTEMRRVATRIGFGAPLEDALRELGDRLPSREVAVLTSTLVVSARSGGSLVTALRDIADTLEARKETRREIRTTLAQSLATGYLVIAMGFGLLLLLNTIAPGTVEKMTTTPVGQLALVAAALLFGGGFLVIRRMTRFDS